MKMSEYLRQQPRSYILGLSVLLVTLIASVEFLLPGVSLTPLCLIPIAIAAVPLGRWGGYVTSAVAMAAWFYLALRRYPETGLAPSEYADAGAWAVSFVFVSEVLSRVKTAYVAAWEKSNTDGITGAATAQYFYAAAQTALGDARRSGECLSFATIHITRVSEDDLFEPVMVGVSAVLRKLARRDDVVGRVGDYRFMILMPATHAKASRAIARRVEDHLIKEIDRHGWKETFAISSVCFESLPSDLEEMKTTLGRTADEVAAAGQNTMKHQVI